MVICAIPKPMARKAEIVIDHIVWCNNVFGRSRRSVKSACLEYVETIRRTFHKFEREGFPLLKSFPTFLPVYGDYLGRLRQRTSSCCIPSRFKRKLSQEILFPPHRATTAFRRAPYSTAHRT